MIRCIATDMDGTLLNSKGQISPENREAIIKAQKKGIEVVIATGRSYQEVTYLLDEAGIKCPVIAINGAEVRSSKGDILSAIPLDHQTAKKAAEILREHEVYFEVYTEEGACTVDEDKAVSIIVDIVMSANPELILEDVVSAAQKRVDEGRVKKVEGYDQLFESPDTKIYKFLAFSFDSEKLEAANKALSSLRELAVSTSGHENLEITNKNAQKGIALEAFVKARGIDMSETMAIGDNFNDVSMFERVGRAVAMGNANPVVKTLCDMVTDTNIENGVAKAILEVL